MILGAYRAIFAVRGAASFCAAAFVMRMAMSIYPIGLVLLVSLRTGHYSFAGVLTGAYVVANGIGNPVLARYLDRYGQTRLIAPLTAVHVAAVALLVLLAHENVADWLWLLPTAVAGFFYLAVGSLVRARWSLVLTDASQLGTSFSLESSLDEVIFVVGPLLATVLATQISPLLVLVVAALLVCLGAGWLSALRGSAPPPHEAGALRPPSALRLRGVPALTLAMFGCGGFFAGAELAMIAFASSQDAPGKTGLLLACMAGGSAVAGFGYGARHWSTPLLRRYLLQGIAMALLPLGFLFARSMLTVGLAALVAGLAVAPTLITGMGLVERIVPDASLTEGIAWMTTGIGVGYGALAALVGRLADVHGPQAGFAAAVACAALVALAALALYMQLRGAPLPGDRVAS